MGWSAWRGFTISVIAGEASAFLPQCASGMVRSASLDEMRPARLHDTSKKPENSRNGFLAAPWAGDRGAMETPSS
jgi:hypothetical protein